MKRYQDRRHKVTCRTVAATVQYRMLRTFMVLLLVLSSFSGYAQFITIKLDIPTKTGQSMIVPLELGTKPGSDTGFQILEGIGVLCISGVENFQVLATLSHSDSLRNETGHAVSFKAYLAYRNDGNNAPPGTDANHQASFPLSNCGRIIENIKNSPQVLQATIFIHANATLPENTKTTYAGDLNFTIEYN